MMIRSTVVLALALSGVASFSVSPLTSNQRESALSPLFMGRAAAVRAATKSKTDAKKAKTNALFGKRIIMAVKQVRKKYPTTIASEFLLFPHNTTFPFEGRVG